MPRKMSPAGFALIKTFAGCHKRDGDVFKP